MIQTIPNLDSFQLKERKSYRDLFKYLALTPCPSLALPESLQRKVYDFAMRLKKMREMNRSTARS
jgi:hypothetical protein